jgi:hypothetical protein
MNAEEYGEENSTTMGTMEDDKGEMDPTLCRVLPD